MPYRYHNLVDQVNSPEIEEPILVGRFGETRSRDASKNFHLHAGCAGSTDARVMAARRRDQTVLSQREV